MRRFRDVRERIGGSSRARPCTSRRVGALLLVGAIHLPTPALFAVAGSAEYAPSRDQLFVACLIGFLLFIVFVSYLRERRRKSSGTPQRSPRWLGPLMLVGLVFLTADAFLAVAGSGDYARRHGRLFTVCLLAFLLFVVRVTTTRATPSLFKAARSADQRSEYLRGGWVAEDLFLLLSVAAAVFVLDWGGWRDYVVQIGVVSALVVVRIVVSLVQRALGRK